MRERRWRVSTHPRVAVLLGAIALGPMLPRPVLAQQQPSVPTMPAQDPWCLGCELLPEYRTSPLLTQLRACHAVLGEATFSGASTHRCFRRAAQLLRTYEVDSQDLARERDAFVAFLERETTNASAKAMRVELQQHLQSLRTTAASLRARTEGVVALVSQGGVSLGNWQAGLLYLLIEHLKATRSQQRQDPLLPTVTGASAGAVNGLIAASASCESATPRPEDSLFYRVWVNLGIDGGENSLLDEHSSTLALFSERALDAAMLRSATHFSDVGRYTRAECAVQFGLTLTHLNDNRVVLHENAAGDSDIEGVTQRERFALKLAFGDNPGAAANRTPQLRAQNIEWPPFGELLDSDSALSNRFPLLGRSPFINAEIPLETLFMAVRGSGAFPGAFPPVQLPFRRLRNNVVGEQQWATFIDGGVFDNTPLGLAIQLETARKSEGRPGQPTMLSHALVPLAPVSYVLVDPAATGWRLGNESRQRADDREDLGIINTYQRFVGRFIGSSRHAALVEAAERWPFVTRGDRTGLGPSLLVPRRNLPIAGEQLGAFLAFLERDFRIFDFYVGMADAAEMLRDEPCLKAGDHARAGAPVQSAKFVCLRDYYAGIRAQKSRIRDSDLPASCNQIEDPGLASETVSSRNFRALIVAAHNYKLWTTSNARGAPGAAHYDPGYTEDREFDTFFSELRNAQFEFVDLPKVTHSDGISSSADARRAVRLLMQRAVDQMSDEQPTALSRSTFRIAGRAVADQYDVLRSDFLLGLGLVTQGGELVLGLRLTDVLRLDVALRVFHFDYVELSRELDLWKFDSAASLTFTAVLPLASPLDLEIGSGTVATITWATERQAFAAFRVGPRLSLGAVLIRRFYLTLDGEYFPFVLEAESFQGDHAPIARHWRMSLGAGMRLLW